LFYIHWQAISVWKIIRVEKQNRCTIFIRYWRMKVFNGLQVRSIIKLLQPEMLLSSSYQLFHKSWSSAKLVTMYTGNRLWRNISMWASGSPVELSDGILFDDIFFGNKTNINMRMWWWILEIVQQDIFVKKEKHFLF
jgi:hypothetical protein